MRSAVMWMLALAAAGFQPDVAWPALSEIVAKLGTTADGLPADLLKKQMTSYATLAEDGEFAVAGWEYRGAALEPPLYVGLRQRGGAWRMVELPETGQNDDFGSVMKISRVGSHLVIDTHLTPSAGAIAVVRNDLTYVTRLYGWLLTSLPDGLIIFHRSMIHFAPAHPGELATFDPVTRTESQLYPTNKATPLRREFIERIRPTLEEYRKREPSNVYGFDPAWFDVSFADPQYDAKTDTLTVLVTFRSDRVPADIAPPQTSELIMTCRPMRSPSRICVEARVPSKRLD